MADGTAPQIEVKFGNVNPQHQVPVISPESGEVIGQQAIPHPILNQSVTSVEFWPGIDDAEAVEHTLSTDNDRMLTLISRTVDPEHKRFSVLLNEFEQIVQAHSAGVKPTWVTSSDPAVADAISKFYDIPVGEPTALLTTAGRDIAHAQLFSTSAPPATSNYMAVASSATWTTPAAGDTTVVGEITTAGGGLLRAQATYAHTAGTNTTTLSHTFTANGSDSLPVTIPGIGVLNASSAGTLLFKTALTASATLNTSGDNVAITETATVG